MSELVELDTLRAETMRRLLNEEGRQEIWKYDVITSADALAAAGARYNFDNAKAGIEAASEGKKYALVGPGLLDYHFSTPEELVHILEWLCRDGGYLSCYGAEVTSADKRRARP